VRGLILSVLVVPARGADPLAFRKLIEDVIALVERSPDAGRPVPPGGPPLRWPPPAPISKRAPRGRIAVEAAARCAHVYAVRLSHHALSASVSWLRAENLCAAGVENSDFRKYDDGLRMILDCTPELEAALTRRLTLAASAGVVRYGLPPARRGDDDCFTPSALRSDHVHFIDAHAAAMPRRRRR